MEKTETVPELTLSELQPELADLDPALAAALNKNPGDRFARCQDFARALTEPLESKTPAAVAPTTPAVSVAPKPRPTEPAIASTSNSSHRADELTSPRTNRGRWIAAAAVAGVVAVTAVSALLWHPGTREKPPAATTGVETPSLALPSRSGPLPRHRRRHQPSRLRLSARYFSQRTKSTVCSARSQQAPLRGASACSRPSILPTECPTTAHSSLRRVASASSWCRAWDLCVKWVRGPAGSNTSSTAVCVQPRDRTAKHHRADDRSLPERRRRPRAIGVLAKTMGRLREFRSAGGRST